MSLWGTVHPSTSPVRPSAEKPRSSKAALVTSTARSRLLTSARAPCHLAKGDDQANPAGMYAFSNLIVLLPSCLHRAQDPPTSSRHPSARGRGAGQTGRLVIERPALPSCCLSGP